MAWLLTLVMLLALMPTAALAVNTKTFTVANGSEFASAVQEINNAANGEFIIQLAANIDLRLDVTFTKNTTTILGEGYTISGGNNATLGVKNDAVLKLGAENYDKTLTLEGGSTGPLAYAAGTAKLYLYDHVTLQNNKVYGSAGGVQINDGASFYMYGGTITNCADLSGGILVFTGSALIGPNTKIFNNSASVAGDDILNLGGTITVAQLPSGMTLSSTGKAITGWYEDGVNDVRWHCEEEDPTKNHLERIEPVTNYTEQLALKAAHGLDEAAPTPAPVTPKEPEGNLLQDIIGSGVFFVPKDFPFYDVDANDWFYNAVKSAWENELIDGVTARYFKPESTLTVAQAIKLAAALHQKQSVGFVTLQNGGTHWYDNYVNYAVANNLIEEAYQSKSAETMNAPVTRAEFVHILAKLLNAGTINTVNSIPDVKSGDAYADEIFAFYRAGILTGSDRLGTFHPESSLKRSEAAAILVRLYDAAQRQYITLR